MRESDYLYFVGMQEPSPAVERALRVFNGTEGYWFCADDKAEAVRVIHAAGYPVIDMRESNLLAWTIAYLVEGEVDADDYEAIRTWLDSTNGVVWKPALDQLLLDNKFKQMLITEYEARVTGDQTDELVGAIWDKVASAKNQVHQHVTNHTADLLGASVWASYPPPGSAAHPTRMR